MDFLIGITFMEWLLIAILISVIWGVSSIGERLVRVAHAAGSSYEDMKQTEAIESLRSELFSINHTLREILDLIGRIAYRQGMDPDDLIE